MTDLMKRFNYCGWYIGIMNEDTYAMEEKDVPEFGPFSKNMASRIAWVFNKAAKKSRAFKTFYAVAISGREALIWAIQKAEKQAGWDPNP